MNNIVFFKGVLKGVETKLLTKRQSTLHRIEIAVDEFFFDQVELIKHPTTNNYYLTKFNWKNEKDYLIDEEYYFVCRATYKKVVSRKGVDKEGNPFSYGTFDFDIRQIFKTKEELRAYLIENLLN